MPTYCQHKPSYRERYGTDTRANGLVICRTCQLPTEESAGTQANRKAERVLIVTTNEVPGHRITEVYGDAFGLTVRARGMFSNLGAQMRTVVGGEVGGYTQLLIDTRNDARARLVEAALRLGANAVVAFRFDCNEIGDIMTEVVAYGTAVTIEPVDLLASRPSPAPSPS